jgi:hypothetical protein
LPQNSKPLAWNQNPGAPNLKPLLNNQNPMLLTGFEIVNFEEKKTKKDSTRGKKNIP